MKQTTKNRPRSARAAAAPWFFVPHVAAPMRVRDSTGALGIRIAKLFAPLTNRDKRDFSIADNRLLAAEQLSLSPQTPGFNRAQFSAVGSTSKSKVLQFAADDGIALVSPGRTVTARHTRGLISPGACRFAWGRTTGLRPWD
jgi:hypothetical protein